MSSNNFFDLSNKDTGNERTKKINGNKEVSTIK